MYNPKTPIWIQGQNWRNQYKVDETMNSKVFNIDAYLIHHISPKTNDYKYNTVTLSKVFNCSRHTIYRAINVLRQAKTISVKHHHIHLKGYQPNIKD